MVSRAPGIHFEENPERIAVTPANATLAAFMGVSKRGRTDRPLLVESWEAFLRNYGSFTDSYGLALVAWEFFRNGGSAARFLRMVAADAVGAANITQFMDRANTKAFDVYASNEGEWSNDLASTTTRKEIAAVGRPSALDPLGIPLPIDSATIRLVLSTLTDVSVGDVFDAFDPTTGARLAASPLVVLAVNADDRSILFIDPGTFLATAPADTVLRSCSMHRARSFATGQLAIGATEVVLDSTDGLSPGSLLSLHQYSHCLTAVARNVSRRFEAVVDRIIGKRVIFTAPLGNAAIIASATRAFITHNVNDVVPTPDALTFEAVSPGPGGNRVTMTLRAGAAFAVTVTGNNVSVDFVVGGTLPSAIQTAVNNHAVASQLVTAAVVGGNAAVINGLNQTALTGGARLLAESQEFGLTIKEEGIQVEDHQFLSLVPASPDYVEKRLGGTLVPLGPDDNNESIRILVVDNTDNVAAELIQQPLSLTDVRLSGGVDGAIPTDDEMLGTEAPRTGLFLFDEYEDIDFVAAPNFTGEIFAVGAAAWAALRGNIYLILDMPEDLESKDEMIVHRQQNLGLDNSFSGLFAPWGSIDDPRGPRGRLLSVPPSPMIAGAIAAAIDGGGAHVSVGNRRPLWRGLSVNIPERDHGPLNEAGINIIRRVARSGIRVYGDRTLSQRADPRRFGNVRRWLNFLRQSLSISLAPVAFQAANTSLFGQIQEAVGRFLTREWQKGALFPDDNINRAFRVKCDSETTTADDLADGNIICLVEVSPVTPAEKIIFRLNISAGGIEIVEQI